MNKLAKGLAVAGLATGIVAGTLSTGTGALVGYFSKESLDALASEYSQTQEFSDLKEAEEQRLAERYQFLQEAKQDYASGLFSSEQMQALEDEYSAEVEYFEQDYVYDCLANSDDKYFQEKLEKCKTSENVANGFFYTGVAIYGLKFLIAGANAGLSVHGKLGDSPVCTTTYLRNAIDYVMQK